MDDLKLELLPGHFTAGRPMSCTSCVLALAVRDKYLGTYHHAVISVDGTAMVGATPWEEARSTYAILPSKEAKKLISEFDHLFIEWKGEGTREFKKEALALYEKYKNVEFSLKKVAKNEF